MQPEFDLKLASSGQDVNAAQRLRYQVFVEEMGAGGALVDHDQRLERDRFDPFMQHMLLFDRARPGDDADQIVAAYRMMDEAGAEAAGGFYSDSEYDLSLLRDSGRKLLEFGRSCVHKDYRAGPAMHKLWQGLVAHVFEGGFEVLFGTASFHGTDVQALAPSLSLLASDHAAPEALQARATPYTDMRLIAPDQIDRIAAMRAVPPLIKAYLKLGGRIGDGAFVDHTFNTTDVMLILDVAEANPRQLALYRQGQA